MTGHRPTLRHRTRSRCHRHPDRCAALPAPARRGQCARPGVYCLRRSEIDRDAETLWRTFSMVTDLEAVFRSLKSQLGLRPVFHHKEARVDGHLFITMLAYQFVQILRRTLQDQGIQANWSTVRQWLSSQVHVTRFRTPVVHHVSHILLPAAPDDHEYRRPALAKAEAMLTEIGSDPGLFTAMAITQSAYSSRNAGGDLGPIGRGQTVPEFEEALERLVVGEIAARAVETRYGVHLVYLCSREGGEPLPFEAVQAQISEYMEQHMRRCAIAQYLQRLVGNAWIQGIDLEGADTPLVQ